MDPAGNPENATKDDPAPDESPSPSWHLSRLDLLERLLVLAFYAWFFWKFTQDFIDDPTWYRALVIASECVTVFFLLIRRPARDFSSSVGDWLLALGATLAPAWVSPGGNPLKPEWVGATLLILGLSGQIVCKIVLGRSFGLVAAHRGLKVNGPYRIVRHPNYASYLLTHMGVFWLYPTPWNVVVYLLAWGLQIARILAEESLLGQDPQYREYQKKVRYRLIPGVF